jgi:DNA-binding transcriptional ArsR family regulator
MASRKLPVLPAAQARGTEPNRTASVEQRIAQALAKLGLALKHQTWQQATEEGLSPTQGQLLGLLAPVDGGLTASELAERLGVSLPTVSESVKSLESKGLLTRAPDPRHPRASLLTPHRPRPTCSDQGACVARVPRRVRERALGERAGGLPLGTPEDDRGAPALG